MHSIVLKNWHQRLLYIVEEQKQQQTTENITEHNDNTVNIVAIVTPVTRSASANVRIGKMNNNNIPG